MLSSILETTSSGAITLQSFLLCAAVSLLLGFLAAFAYMYKNHYSKGFVVTLALLPLMVQVVITLVNGNLGVGVAVAGAFSLIRFRSVAGGGREIGSVFLAMAIGLATGMGYVGAAVLLGLTVCLIEVLLMNSRFGDGRQGEKELKIQIPENLDYAGVFEDVFEKYTTECTEQKVKTAGMGSLYELSYRVILRSGVSEQAFLDEIRTRNGNLSVSLGRTSARIEEL